MTATLVPEKGRFSRSYVGQMRLSDQTFTQGQGWESIKKYYLSAMIKEPKNVDFYTTGRQPSAQEFARISAWIKRDKKKQAARNSNRAKAPNA